MSLTVSTAGASPVFRGWTLMMANHPNRAMPEVEAKMEFVLQMAGNLVVAASKALNSNNDSTEFENLRKQALRATNRSLRALKMMGGEAPTA